VDELEGWRREARVDMRADEFPSLSEWWEIEGERHVAVQPIVVSHGAHESCCRKVLRLRVRATREGVVDRAGRGEEMPWS
jgi:homospermidine synthase